MSNPTVITYFIGNGIGMALNITDEDNQNIFSLEYAMKQAYQNSQNKSELKTVITNIAGECPPKDEDELRHLQRWLWSIEKEIINDENNKSLIKEYFFDIAHWFSDIYFDKENKVLKSSSQKTINESSSNDFSSFIKYLSKRIIESSENKEKIHIATSNYDKLLYSGFYAQEIFNKKGTKYLLCDAPKIAPIDGPWFLHLHGTLLFNTNEDGIPSKSDIFKDLKKNWNKREHFILTDRNFKHSKILESPILKKYWEIFKDRVLKETSKLIIIGYGGNDPHINDAIRNSAVREIHVLEYDKKGFKKAVRTQFWESKFKNSKSDTKNITVTLKSNILKISDEDFQSDLES